ncbi:MAG: hypothetical protein HYS26_01795 [Candidatus Kaiserbacteria bacterium]|nr:MAG: hypothetical protein HYS26_01795 [Candidatus Kaiserbacteria bacterium]
MKKLLSVPPMTLIRIGLALVFLANSITAFVYPSEFIELIEASFVAGILGLVGVSPALFVVGIGFNDAIVAALLFLNRGRVIASVWASLWLVAVLLVRGEPLEILEESGFLLMALALAQESCRVVLTSARKR